MGAQTAAEKLARLLPTARAGDAAAREALIESFLPFILRVASPQTGRYLRVGEDEEVVEGMLAFNEAVDSYDPRRGRSFLGFTAQVIRRRLIDGQRRRRSEGREVSWSRLAEDRHLHDVLLRRSLEAHRSVQEAAAIREEIRRCDTLLREYGITFRELAARSPRHRDAREGALWAARVLAEDPALAAALGRTRKLPLAQLCRRVDLSPRSLQRHRSYIVALTLLLLSRDFPGLREFLRPPPAGVRAGRAGRSSARVEARGKGGFGCG